MKELETISKHNIEVIAELRKHKFIGKLVPQKGHTCFEYNLSTGVLRPAEFTAIDAEYNVSKSYSIRKKVITKEDCHYVTALNKKNAFKQVLKDLQTIKQTK